MRQNPTAGLRLRANIWHINGIQVEGHGPIFQSTGTSDPAEAARIRDEVVAAARKDAAERDEQARLATLYGIRPKVTFRELAIIYLEDQADTGKVSLPDEARAIKWMDAYIGDLHLDGIYDETLKPMIEAMRATGVKSRTIRAKLEVVRHMLKLAARKYRHPVTKLTLLSEAPLITMPPMRDKRPPYPLSWEEQRVFFPLLPDHLAKMALYTVNTGARDEEVTGLMWKWENRITFNGKPVSVFVLPTSKNGKPRVVVLNEVAQAVVDSCRGEHPEYVFTYRDRNTWSKERHRVNAVNQNGWRTARAKAAKVIPALADLHFHDLRHTCGRRMRAAGVSNETRADILGHENGNMTTEYSQAELAELYEAVQKIAHEPVAGAPQMTMLRVVNG